MCLEELPYFLNKDSVSFFFPSFPSLLPSLPPSLPPFGLTSRVRGLTLLHRMKYLGCPSSLSAGRKGGKEGGVKKKVSM